jgi:uncharacterized membrane protein
MTTNVKLSNLFQRQSLLIITLLLVVGIGIFFRFYNIDQKVYWQDETATSVRVAGYSKIGLRENLFQGNIITAGELIQQYQYPNADRNWEDTLAVLKQKAEHPPLYYLLTRWWVQLFGDSIAVMRSLPALISLFVFPSLYWLGRELFREQSVTAIAIALIAVSPIHVLYAQEAREYSLWIVATILSSALLLKSLRVNTKTSWLSYSFSLMLGLYSHLLFIWVMLAHGIYVMGQEGIKFSQKIKQYLWASLAGIAALIPWIVVMIHYWLYSPYPDQILADVGEDVPLSFLVDRWFRGVNRVFHDVDFGSPNIVLVLLSFYAFYFLCRHAKKQTWWFLVSLTAVTGLAIMLPDVLFGGKASVRNRYLFPSYIGLEITMAYLFAKQMMLSKRHWQQWIWRGVTVFFIAAGIISCAVNSQASTWWNKNDDVTEHYLNVAEMINQQEESLVVTDTSVVNTLTLSHLLESEINLQLVKSPYNFQIPQECSPIFLFDPSSQLQAHLQNQENRNWKLIYEESEAKLLKQTSE